MELRVRELCFAFSPMQTAAVEVDSPLPLLCGGQAGACRTACAAWPATVAAQQCCSAHAALSSLVLDVTVLPATLGSELPALLQCTLVNE